MSGRYSSGEVKVRPGVYFRETKGGGAELVGARNGVVAAAFRANWGPIGEVITLESPAEIPEYYGDDAGTNSNVAMLEKIFPAARAKSAPFVLAKAARRHPSHSRTLQFHR